MAFTDFYMKPFRKEYNRLHWSVILLLFILLAGSAIGVWLARHRSSTFYAVIYLWLVRLGEPHNDLVESHPKYLTQSLFQGGNLR